MLSGVGVLGKSNLKYYQLFKFGSHFYVLLASSITV